MRNFVGGRFVGYRDLNNQNPYGAEFCI
ncbi:uncharacterized protein METZ01_LOCUS353313 [marine metagenome]|uniref:Uncharacterized protein n=1 Tax=marine metagenome TaxID=408172 RepID=A0A382RS03_9ZZZZ